MNLARVIIAALGLVLGASALAQTYPQRPVRMIVPFAAGGTTDAVGRVLAHYLGERLGQQVVVDNRPGGGSTIGSEAVARATADGYTVLFNSQETYGITEADMKRLTYNPQKDLVPVAMVARAPNAFVVHPSVKAMSTKELIELARANPGKLRYGSPGIGTNVHIIGEAFKHRFKIDMVHVPYKGGGQAINDVVSGQIEVLIGGAATVAPRVRAGQVRGLALTGGTRAAIMPDVPTMAEAGVSDFVLGPLFGVFVPAGTPAAVTERLAREIVAVTKLPEFKKRLTDIGAEEVEPLTGDGFGRHMLEEVQRWREMAAAVGIKGE